MNTHWDSAVTDPKSSWLPFPVRACVAHVPLCMCRHAPSPTFPQTTPVPNAWVVSNLHLLKPLPGLAEMPFAPSPATAQTA